MESTRGITLMEVIIAMAVMGIIGALAFPTFSRLLQDSQRTATVNRFFHALFLARSESIKRGQIVSLCKSRDGEWCDRDLPWDAGWIVFVNKDGREPAMRNPDEQLIAAYEGWPQGTITSNRGSYSFRPDIQGVVNGTLVFCDHRGPAHARAIIISHTGRPRIAQRDSRGKPLACPR